MLFQDILPLAIENLKRRLFRTSLTVVGVVIGTMPVVLMSSLGFAVSTSMMESYSSLRLRTIDVYLAADHNRPEISVPITSEIIAEISQLPGVVSSYGVYETPLEIKVSRHSASVLVVGLPAEAYGVLDFVYADGAPRRISASTAGVLYEDPDEWGEYSTSIFADQEALITALKKMSPRKTLPGQKA